MGLLSEYVYLNITGNIKKYYEELGYDIPKKLNKNGKLVLDNKTYIKIKIEDLMKNSNKKVKVQCDCCKNIYEYTYNNYNSKRMGDKYYCFHCYASIFNSGENNCNWNHNLSEEDRLRVSRKSVSYNEFIRRVLNRDEYTCKVCENKNKQLEVHHLDGYNWCKEKRESIENGITLCLDCHSNFHSLYGRGFNTKDQFEEWFGSAIYLTNNGHEILPTRKIYCIEENKIYDSSFDFKNTHNLKSDTYIFKLCNHSGSVEYKKDKFGNIKKYDKKAFTVNGLHILWYDEYLKMKDDEIKRFLEQTQSPIKKVICLTTNEIFNNIKMASEKYNCNKNGVSNCCKGIYKTSGKLENGISLTWMFYEDFVKLDEKEKENIINVAKLQRGRTTKRKVMCMNTNEIFNSTRMASRSYNISKSGVSACCRGELSYCGKDKISGEKLLWKYID